MLRRGEGFRPFPPLRPPPAAGVFRARREFLFPRGKRNQKDARLAGGAADNGSFFSPAARSGRAVLLRSASGAKRLLWRAALSINPSWGAGGGDRCSGNFVLVVDSSFVGRGGYSLNRRAMAWADMPEPSPVKPRRSSVVALTLTWSTEISRSWAIFWRICWI